MLKEVVFQPIRFRLAHVLRFNDEDTFISQLRAQLTEAGLLLTLKLAYLNRDLLQLFCRGQTIIRNGRHIRSLLTAQASNTHHEELIKVVGRDGQEPEPFQKRMARVHGFFQNTAVELQPREFTVYKALWFLHQSQPCTHLKICGVSGLVFQSVHFRKLIHSMYLRSPWTGSPVWAHLALRISDDCAVRCMILVI